MLTRYKSPAADSKSITASNSIRSSSRKTVKPERLIDVQISVGKCNVRKLDKKPIPQEYDGLHGYDGTDGFVVRDFDEHVDAEEEDNEELVQTDDETETEKDDDVELDDDDTEDEEEEEDELD